MATNKSMTICEKEEMQLKRMLSFRLPQYFFQIGIGLFLTAFLYLILHKIYAVEHEVYRIIARNVMMVALVLCSLAKDKVEDERTQLIRAQSYSLAFIFGVIYAILQPFIDFGVDHVVSSDPGELEEASTIAILFFMISIQLGFFYTFKRRF